MIAVPTLHPAYLLRSTDEDKGNARFKLTVIDDIKRAVAYLRRRPNWDESVIWERDQNGRLRNLFPTLEEVRQFCVEAWRGELEIDIETSGEEPLNCKILCIGLCCGERLAICVPLLKQGGARYWSMSEELQVISWLAYLFRDAETLKVLQNGINFDSVVLTPFGMPISGPTHDTMAAHHVADGELPHGLAYLGSRYTEVPYYKDATKGDARWIDMDETTLRAYCARDVLTTRRANRPLLTEVDRLGLGSLYHEEIQVCSIMARASLRGIQVDLERRRELLDQYRGDRARHLAGLRELAGDPEFNPRSPPQLTDLLFRRLGFPIVRRTQKSKAPSTDKHAMAMLAVHAEREEQMRCLRDLVAFKKHNAMTQWIESMPVLPDDRVHASWNLLAITGRLVSSPNMQNHSLRMKSMFRSGRGYRLVSVDLSQAELRAEAYFANDEDLLRMYQLGVNVHTANAALLFGIHCANPKDSNPATEAYLIDACRRHLNKEYSSLPEPTKDNWKLIRTLAKIEVFIAIYGGASELQLQQASSKRDPTTDELLFPKLTLREVDAFNAMWRMLHPSIPIYWNRLENQVKAQGFYQCPLSGRMIWFRGGFARSKILDVPNQTLVSSRVNKGMIAIDELLQKYCPGAVIVSQVHDAITAEVPEQHVRVAGEIMFSEFQKTFPLPGFPAAILPAEAATEGIYFSEV